MPVKKAKDFRGMPVKELEAHVRELRKEYFDLRIQKATGQLRTTSVPRSSARNSPAPSPSSVKVPPRPMKHNTEHKD